MRTYYLEKTYLMFEQMEWARLDLIAREEHTALAFDR